MLLEMLLDACGYEMGVFKPIAWYDPEMDQTTYLTQDVSYRSKWVNNFLSLLLHPYEDTLVGVQISGQYACLSSAIVAAYDPRYNLAVQDEYLKAAEFTQGVLVENTL